jgi:hypothetical protein
MIKIIGISDVLHDVCIRSFDSAYEVPAGPGEKGGARALSVL